MRAISLGLCHFTLLNIINYFRTRSLQITVDRLLVVFKLIRYLGLSAKMDLSTAEGCGPTASSRYIGSECSVQQMNFVLVASNVNNYSTDSNGNDDEVSSAQLRWCMCVCACSRIYNLNMRYASTCTSTSFSLSSSDLSSHSIFSSVSSSTTLTCRRRRYWSSLSHRCLFIRWSTCKLQVYWAYNECFGIIFYLTDSDLI